MGHPIPTDASGSPTRWLIVFDLAAATWWASLIALGRYKHARTFGYVHACDVWVFYDCQFRGTFIQMARGEEARRLISEWTADADVLAIDGTPMGFHRFSPRFPPPLLCTTAVARLIGLPCGALRPDALYAQCLRHGATIVQVMNDGASDHYDQRSGARKAIL